MTKELSKKESIKIKCPLCKDKIPSNALRCSKCAGDLDNELVQRDIQLQLQKHRKTQVVVGGLFAVAIILMIMSFSGDSTPSQPSKPTYKIDFVDGSSFYAEDFSRIDAKGSGGDGCVEFIAMTNYVSANGKTTNKGETMLHCGTYKFSPPYIEGGY